MNFLKTPSNIQKQAIMHLSGPAMVSAGPGSGKTFTIIQRILYLVCQCRISPDNILVITYTKAAALEMKERYEKALSGREKIPETVLFGTFHSICYSILKSCGKVRENSLIKENQKRSLIKNLLQNAGLSEYDRYDTISHILNEISRNKNCPERGTGHLTELSMEEFEKISRGYQSYLKQQGLIDFDDMIAECLKLLMNDLELCTNYRRQFSYILADEFQDINPLQYEILRLLSAPENNLFVVGDDDQAIYGFRGATPAVMERFLSDFPCCQHIYLTENYRSGEQIVRLSQKVIERNKRRIQKNFYPTRRGGNIQTACFDNRKQEEDALIDHLKSRGKKELEQTAIIVRTNLEAIMYRELLLQKKIPVKGGKKKESTPLHTFLAEDMCAFLSYVYCGNKRRDLFGFMNKPERFLLREAFAEEVVQKQTPLLYFQNNPEMKEKVIQLLDTLTLAGTLTPRLSLSLFRKKLGYDAYIKEQASDFRTKQRYQKQADELQELFSSYTPGKSVQDFVADLKRKQEEEGLEKETAGNGVSVLTMHASKGLEFDSVYLPDLNEGIIPGKKIKEAGELEEERRLLYVAITRARNELFLFYTKERNRRLSRFLEGIIPLHQP